MWREPEAMRKLPWSRRFALLFGGEPWTKGEAAALEEYVDWLRGPGLLIRPAAIGFGALLGVLVVIRAPVLEAVSAGATVFVVATGMMVLVRQQALTHVGETSEGLSVRHVVVTAGLTLLAVVAVFLGTHWMTHRVTVLVTGDDLLQVVSDVDEQWWGRVDTIVVPGTDQVPSALERETPDILLLTGAIDPVAEGVGPGSVIARRGGDPETVVTLHLANGDEATEDLVQELFQGAGPDAFRRAGFVRGQATNP